jgi:predicted ArsR family transcriptional regulator
LRSVRGLVEVLRGAGYEPRIEPDGSVCLRNCPYDALVADHRDVTCGMNLAWAGGLVDGLGIKGLEVELDPAAGRCCVVIHPAE